MATNVSYPETNLTKSADLAPEITLDCLITSQNATAPKLRDGCVERGRV